LASLARHRCSVGWLGSTARHDDIDAEWLNDAVKGFLPAQDPGPATVVYDGECLTVSVPSPEYLLATKLLARGRQLFWWRPEPPGWPARLWDRVPRESVLPMGGVVDLRGDAAEAIVGGSGTMWRSTTDPNAWQRHLCQVLGEVSTADRVALGDRLPTNRCTRAC
jgi:hypothetical protein